MLERIMTDWDGGGGGQAEKTPANTWKTATATGAGCLTIMDNQEYCLIFRSHFPPPPPNDYRYCWSKEFKPTLMPKATTRLSKTNISNCIYLFSPLPPAPNLRTRKPASFLNKSFLAAMKTTMLINTAATASERKRRNISKKDYAIIFPRE